MPAVTSKLRQLAGIMAIRAAIFLTFGSRAITGRMRAFGIHITSFDLESPLIGSKSRTKPIEQVLCATYRSAFRERPANTCAARADPVQGHGGRAGLRRAGQIRVDMRAP
jgi:hypothetical protein